MLHLNSMFHAALSIGETKRKEVITMQNRILLVLEEGNSPFVEGPEYSCCLAGLMPLR